MIAEPDDDEPSPQDIAAAERILETEEAFCAAAIARLYGPLPEWLPTPVLPQIRQALAAQRNAGQSPERISETISVARRGRYDVPGSVLDSVDFIKSANYLAHVQWALEQGKARALTELSGRAAAIGQRTVEQRRTYSRKGNEAKRERASQREHEWLAIGRPLRSRLPNMTDNQLAQQIASKTGSKPSTIRAALKKLGLAKKK